MSRPSLTENPSQLSPIEATNSLRSSASSYLRSAMHQPVQWHEWSEEAFAKAAAEDKPILLDIGAVWCHWCHVMDRESYEDPKLAAVVNENFIAIKVDRDERPDVDSRYQAAVQSMSGQGGWPLTAILTPEGKPYFGGTYFPPDQRYGRPSFEHVLRTMAKVWQTQRDEVNDTAGSVMAAIEHGETFAGRSGQLSATLVEKLVGHAVSQFDPHHGGFGSQPKFPHPSTLDLLIDHVGRTDDEAAKKAVVVTLEKMARGGIYDQLGGGFHRYSVDERWVVPHFEKMLYDNAGLLKNYVHAYQSFVDPQVFDSQFGAVAKDIIRWMDAELTDRERGGFYASQDADVTLDDDGDYFTWTREEAAAVLTPEELAVVEQHYHIGYVGDMHHNPQKNVLHVNFAVEETARRVKLTVPEVEALIASASTKLFAARLERTAPFIDKTIYTSWNAMAISAYLQAGRVLRLDGPVEFALKTLNRILAEGWSEELGLAHVISYSGDEAGRERIAGVLDDYAFMVEACLDAWEAAGSRKYYEAAAAIGDALVARFYDSVGGGFFDAALPADNKVLGALSARRKPLQDTPTPAGNPSAAIALLRLEDLSGRRELREKAEDTLENFAGIVEHFGLYAGTYGLALQRFLAAPTQVAVIGDGDAALALEATALAGFAVNKSVIRLTAGQISAANLPPILGETLPSLPGIDGGVMAVVCRGNACLPPVRDAAGLLAELAG